MPPNSSASTEAVYLHDINLRTLDTKVLDVQPLSSLSEDDRALFKQSAEDDHVLTTESTIFYPQGGGQPSDVGTITSRSKEGENTTKTTFTVSSVRHGGGASSSTPSILHCGSFSPPSSTFPPGSTVTQEIDSATRDLHSRIHSAGHILGLAVAALSIPGIDEGTRAMHFPSSAFVDFSGLIDGRWKDAIQAKVDEMVKQEIPIEIRVMGFREAGERCRIGPAEMGFKEGDEVRVVEVVGWGAYPCGGTHVRHTGEVGEIGVRRISRQKGRTKISYEVR
ncbi:ThrRS/AlaRS common domain-containing protein [Aulographum hederae CBS 113979]|uniref:ThrRS/AlaRS common domain-containing protein n=1 Tax=Aulographum hederae CBS 113979 TaxID=1176131 RepID=A0A6G1HDL9_9PEZI|nr:ThrRS/AlaRS common domain-containing protein [Aulographum hederae CBS 113979]